MSDDKLNQDARQAAAVSRVGVHAFQAKPQTSEAASPDSCIRCGYGAAHPVHALRV